MYRCDKFPSITLLFTVGFTVFIFYKLPLVKRSGSFMDMYGYPLAKKLPITVYIRSKSYMDYLRLLVKTLFIRIIFVVHKISDSDCSSVFSVFYSLWNFFVFL